MGDAVKLYLAVLRMSFPWDIPVLMCGQQVTHGYRAQERALSALKVRRKMKPWELERSPRKCMWIEKRQGPKAQKHLQVTQGNRRTSTGRERRGRENKENSAEGSDEGQQGPDRTASPDVAAECGLAMSEGLRGAQRWQWK